MSRRNLLLFFLALIFAGITPIPAIADEVTDWTKIMLTAHHTANASPPVASRNSAIVESAIFDAVNGIKGHYTPIHVVPAARKGTSARAAAVAAAYVSLKHVYPAQNFDAAYTASINAILDVPGGANNQAKTAEAVALGIAWGQKVADAIWQWRSTDGFSPAPAPYLGNSATPGYWRPTPPANAAGAVPQFANMTPWVISSPGQFRPAGFPALDSARYAEVYNEVKTRGSASYPHSADEVLYVNFWNGATASYFWNNVALKLAAAETDRTLLENAHLFGELNVAIADAVISCWEAKYYYHFWRPVTAIRLGDTDGNLATDADTGWNPLITTPAHPEYSSGHSTASSAAAAVLAFFFGPNAHIVMDSDMMPGVTREFDGFDAALDEVANARVYGGIHFRSACEDGRVQGKAVANFVIQNSFLPGHGHGDPYEDD
jgi:hypothetical protein